MSLFLVGLGPYKPRSMMLKRLTFIVSLGLISALTANAQQQASKTINVYVTRLQQSTAQLEAFIASKQAIAYKTDFSIDRYSCEFFIKTAYLSGLDSLANSMGYVTQSTFNTENISEKITSLERKNKGLEYENEMLRKQMAVSDSFRLGQDELSRKLINNIKAIGENAVSINYYRQSMDDHQCIVYFTINDETGTPNNSRVSFVNMPGAEYGYLLTENPGAGVSAKAYHGATIKYMFTRGKSYINLGVYRAIENSKTDSTLINELFVINFGQDFYPRYFGRGKRKFLNLYTGYQLGGFITNRNNNKNSAFVPNANLSLGVELFKSKHVLIDNKVSYFLPLNELNRSMRGMLYQASFNFVF
jgi:hypothetical protein